MFSFYFTTQPVIPKEFRSSSSSSRSGGLHGPLKSVEGAVENIDQRKFIPLIILIGTKLHQSAHADFARANTDVCVSCFVRSNPINPEEFPPSSSSSRSGLSPNTEDTRSGGGMSSSSGEKSAAGVPQTSKHSRNSSGVPTSVTAGKVPSPLRSPYPRHEVNQFPYRRDGSGSELPDDLARAVGSDLASVLNSEGNLEHASASTSRGGGGGGGGGDRSSLFANPLPFTNVVTSSAPASQHVSPNGGPSRIPRVRDENRLPNQSPNANAGNTNPSANANAGNTNPSPNANAGRAKPAVDAEKHASHEHADGGAGGMSRASTPAPRPPGIAREHAGGEAKVESSVASSRKPNQEKFFVSFTESMEKFPPEAPTWPYGPDPKSVVEGMYFISEIIQIFILDAACARIKYARTIHCLCVSST